MERSTIHYLKQKGWSNTQIAKMLGCHRDTVGRIVRQAVDQPPAVRKRQSRITVFDEQINEWLECNLSVRRMLEKARNDPEHAYQGSDAAFYNYVQPLRQVRTLRVADVAVRYEGLPGELLQIDWGEVRHFPFTKQELDGQTRYFFAARLKYSRWMFVRFTLGMREETLLRCIIACFVEMGGVPWAVTSDNMKTITLGRDAQNQPIWHPAFQKFAAEFGFHPSLCTQGAANQKGAVENLVKFVKGNFLAGREFYDEQELERQNRAWLQRVNEERVNSATEQIPALLLAEEREKLGLLPATAHDYGFFDSVLVNRESMVGIATNRYSVPAHLVGQTLTVRIYPEHIELFDGMEKVASHPRQWGRNARVVQPAHFEPVFVRKPRARVMVYRDWLVGLSPSAADYISLVCRKYYEQMATQITRLYELAQEVGCQEFLAAMELAAEEQAIGADYVAALVRRPVVSSQGEQQGLEELKPWVDAPSQAAVEQSLSHYERYVHNAAVSEEAGHELDSRP